MKKSYLFLLIFSAFIAVLIAGLSAVHAADIVGVNPSTGEANVLGINPENVPQTQEEWQNQSTSYLKREWVKILDKTPTGKVLLGISNFLSSLDFFWNPVLGMPYSFSWAFIFAITIWFILFYLIYEPAYAIFDQRWMAIVGAGIITSLVGTAGVIKKAVDLLSMAINNKWIAGISFLIALLIMGLIIKFGGGLKAYMKKQKEEAEKEKTEEARKVIQTHGKISKKELESYKEKD